MAPIGRLSKRFLDKIKGADEQTITWSPHDLRRTALTILEAMDVSAYALKRIAAHSQQSDVTAGYLSDDVHRLRAPMERLESEIGRAHVRTPVTNAHLVCRLMLEKKKDRDQPHTI